MQMPKILRPAIVAVVCWGFASTLAAAQTDVAGKPASGTHGKTRNPRAAARPAPTTSSPAANLNAPSTDFSNVEPDTGEPRQRRQAGPNIRPSIDSEGRPVMGLGF